jgi:hypothetical protein
MPQKPIAVDENATVTIPIRNLIAMIFGVAVAVVGYFEVTNRIDILERDFALLRQEVSMNSEFRVKWPRGELGALPDDLIQNADINMMKEQIDLNTTFRNEWAPPPEVQETIRTNHAQEVRIQYLEKRVEKISNGN